MGYPRPRPKHLAAKLLHIRHSLGLSQSQMVQRLGVDIDYNYISKYETNKNEPPLAVLLAYSRATGILVEQMIDDGINPDSMTK